MRSIQNGDPYLLYPHNNGRRNRETARIRCETTEFQQPTLDRLSSAMAEFYENQGYREQLSRKSFNIFSVIFCSILYELIVLW